MTCARARLPVRIVTPTRRGTVDFAAFGPLAPAADITCMGTCASIWDATGYLEQAFDVLDFKWDPVGFCLIPTATSLWALVDAMHACAEIRTS